jgi:hypothetical protein
MKTSSYALTALNGKVVIHRPDGSELFTLKKRDKEFAEEILANLNDGRDKES